MERRGHERSASAEFNRHDHSLELQNSIERLRSEMMHFMNHRFEQFISETKQNTLDGLSKPIAPLLLDTTDIQQKKQNTQFPVKTFRIRPSILTELLEVSHIRSIRQIFISILVILVLQVACKDLFELGSVDFRFDVIRWNFSNLPACVLLWLCMNISTCAVYYCFHFWSYQRLSFIRGNDSLPKKSSRNTSLLVFDWLCFFGYCLYVSLFLYFPVHILLRDNYPIVTRMIVLIEQVRLLMKTHAFVRENAPRAIVYGNIYAKKIKNAELQDEVLDESSKHKLLSTDSTPCPEFSKFLYFIFAPTLLYRDSYPRTSSTRWNYVLSQLVQFIDWWTATSWSSYYRTWNIVVHDWLYTYVYRDCHQLLGVKFRLVSMYAVIFLSACVHEYILTLAFGYFYPILFLQFAILGFISMLILPQRTNNNAFNVFIWASLFVGLGMQMCLYSIEWYARQNCPRSVIGALDYFVPRSLFCTDADSISNNETIFPHIIQSTTSTIRKRIPTLYPDDL
ncbi:unnamed protein product [Didymodactylos carnosus]|uniref:O-acyltransferase n=1 Tax=Didymodactylos carnosus TaxID=1234261 RepID=A0A815JAA6_9BILA|nr:unnamed protein product [Didymodactylos carnosus]CAF1379361.1 unnamed protein product [Didymodactylos carnosus]CAF3896834.1 unnamed protein product [Didymodactylos carnosus]CAF4272939.1 unnamed protein product [Didymodactylos carnosus]